MIPIISFFTDAYASEARKLRDSCDALGMLHDIRRVDDAGSWERNCGQKPAFIRDRLNEHPATGVIWVDADARIRQHPILFAKLECDFAAHWRHDKELLSGTMYFAPTAEALDLLDVWADAMEASPREWDQNVLQQLIESGGWWMAGLRIVHLPAEYVAVDTMELNPDDVVIEHGQASRRLKPRQVSLLMPTYNQGRFLDRAIAGLRSQKFQEFDVMVCNDGSSDDTESILDKLEDGEGDPKFRSIHLRTNLGAALAINSSFGLATAIASSEYVTWVSSDNVMHPGWLSTLVKHLDENPEEGAVYSAYCRCEDGKRLDQYPGDYDSKRLISSENCYFGPSFLIRREVWQDHRGGSAHDYDNWARVEEACWARNQTIGYVPQVLCDYHVGDWNTARVRPELYDADKWRKEAIERRRLSPVLSI